MSTKPNRRFLETGLSGHVHFVNHPCFVCGKIMLKTDRRAIWEINNGWFRGDDDVYGAHEACEPQMANAILAYETTEAAKRQARKRA